MKLALTIGGNTINPPGGVPQGGADTLSKIIQAGITLFFIAAILLALVYLIQGGIQWMTSGGNKQLIDQARLRITYAVIGLIIVFAAFFLVNVVGGFFNIKFF
ncbi:MAG: hypothetical protein A3H50_01865 [Candidatus Levybacteria bacterium RIFCSPLOWO2_02_FULL_37_10]|nr:MAG: hypothetical protein A2860_02175 [Candidatus Levybacteria bacterium RIFCSPHIGHO2_01_FULL_37_33]OGH43151.1 MAG: hypothetical protein A3H50_01865 [Candidatus Levybacteria bacterium RIFCSPLOWO2_02_FULL_37_10]